MLSQKPIAFFPPVIADKCSICSMLCAVNLAREQPYVPNIHPMNEGIRTLQRFLTDFFQRNPYENRCRCMKIVAVVKKSCSVFAL